MIYLYYGNDAYSLKNKMKDYKNQDYEYFYGNLADLKDTLLQTNLFKHNIDKNFIIDLDINSEIKFNSEFTSLLNKIKNKKYSLVLFTSDNITPKQKKIFTKVEKLSVEDNKKIFSFIDDVYNKNKKGALSKASPYIKENMSNYLISMLFFNLKNLFLYYYSKESFTSLNSFVQSKTKVLAKKYDKRKLNEIAFVLSEADYKIKTGGDSEFIITSLILYLIKR